LALARLMLAVGGREPKGDLLTIFSEVLEPLPEDQLIPAFERYERSERQWITLAGFLEEYHAPAVQADFEWLMYYLKKHGWQWQKLRDRWVADGDGPDAPQKCLPGDKPPEMRVSIARTVERLGAGNLRDGLRFLWEYPAASWNEQTEAQYPGQRIKLTQDIEQAWRRAWMRTNG